MPTDQALRDLPEKFTPWTPIEKIIPYVLPTLVALCLTGIIWAVKTQSYQDQRIEVVIERQKQVMADLRALTERIDRQDTPLSKRVIAMESAVESRLQRIEQDTKHFDVMEAEHIRLTKDVEELKRGKK